MPVQPVFESKNISWKEIKVSILIISPFLGLIIGACRDIFSQAKLTPTEVLFGAIIGFLLGFCVGAFLFLIIGLIERRQN